MGSGELCADIRRRVGDGRQVPLKYMSLANGFRLQVDDATEQLVLLHTSDPTMREEVGYQEYDDRLPGMRWYLNPAWRSDVAFLLGKLGMLETVSEDAIPF
jgi:hypothetical protein